jgi:hypothetical protein
MIGVSQVSRTKRSQAMTNHGAPEIKDSTKAAVTGQVALPSFNSLALLKEGQQPIGKNVAQPNELAFHDIFQSKSPADQQPSNLQKVAGYVGDTDSVNKQIVKIDGDLYQQQLLKDFGGPAGLARAQKQDAAAWAKAEKEVERDQRELYTGTTKRKR